MGYSSMDTNVFSTLRTTDGCVDCSGPSRGTFYNVGPTVILGVELGISLIYVLYEVMMTYAQINEGGQI